MKISVLRLVVRPMSVEATISSDGAEVSGFALEQIFFGVALFGLALLVFIPAFNGGFQWGDDQTIVANPQVQSLNGWWTLWLQPQTANYFPLSSTSFWLDWHFWKFDAGPYHVVNALLHGVVAVLTYEDAPAQKFSTARHQNPEDDGADTMVLDRVMRFAGQRAAAVVAESEAASEEGCRRLLVDYEILDAVLTAEAALRAARLERDALVREAAELRDRLTASEAQADALKEADGLLRQAIARLGREMVAGPASRAAPPEREPASTL